MQMLEKVFGVVIKSNLKLKTSKCVFGEHQVLFLGRFISEYGVRRNPAKTMALLEMPEPTDAAGVRRVLGMLEYYRKFILNFASLSEPLTKLLKKNRPFVWGLREEEASPSLLGELARDVTLAHFNHSDPIATKTDASKADVAALLLQRQQGEWRLISCCSRMLNEHERNYGISELEALAIVYAVNKLRSFLLGKHFQILMDHSALSVINQKNPSFARLRRCALILQEFEYTIVYAKGSLQADLDCFSRAPIDPPDDNVERRIFHIATPVNSSKWASHLKDEQSLKFLEAAGAKDGKFEIKSGIIYFGDKLYVPPVLVQRIIAEAHNSAVACHGGVAAASERLMGYWWPSKAGDIKLYVDSCLAYQTRKVERAKPVGTMKSFEIYEAGEMVAIDDLGPIIETHARNRHIMLAIDCPLCLCESCPRRLCGYLLQFYRRIRGNIRYSRKSFDR